MTKIQFKIPFYNTTVILVQVEGKQDADASVALMRRWKIEDDDNYDYNGIVNGAMNGGTTYRQMNQKRIFVLFYPFESDRIKEEVYSHEKRHIEDRILEFFGVNDIESAGLLAGYLGAKFYDFKQLQKNKLSTT